MLKNKRNIVILTGLFLLLIISSSVFVYPNESVGTFEDLDVDASDEAYDNLAYLNGYRREIGEMEDDENPRFKALCREIKMMGFGASERDSFLTDIYTKLYVNPYNYTAFVLTTGDPKEVQPKLVELLKPDDDLSIVVRKAKYTRVEFELFIDEIIESGMTPKSGKYQIGTLYVSNEGIIVVELVDITPENAKAFLDSIPKTIPREILMLRQGGRTQACSLTEEHRPVIGGIMFTEKTALTEFTSTIGVI